MVKKDTLATFRVENDLWEQFKAKATEERFSASALLLQFVEDYVSGRVSSATTGNNAGGRDARIDNLVSRIDSLEKRIDERIDTVKAELEAALDAALEEVRGLIAQGKTNQIDTNQETPISTRELCKRLGIDYSNRNARARRHGKTTEEQLIAEALEKGQHWRVCDRKGNAMFWEQIGKVLAILCE